ncbi:MAG: metallophosphoesterase [Bacteroidota bacterium]
MNRSDRLLLLLTTLLLTLPPMAARAQQPVPLTFLAIGDAGQAGDEMSGNARHMLEQATLGAAAGEPVSLLFFLGDNFYPHGLNGYTDKKRVELIKNVMGPHRTLMEMLGRENVQSIPGNHDYYCTALEGTIPYGVCDAGNQAEAELEFWTYHPHDPAILRKALASGSRDSVDFILFDSALLLNQKTEKWRPVLDSLESVLRRSAAARGVRWRILMAHHSPYSVGAHGGYRLWQASRKRIGYIGNCLSEGEDPTRYVQEFFSDEDNCTPHYRAYKDSLLAILGRSNANIQLMMAGHDHSLQLLYYPDSNSACRNCPKIFIINGAGAKRESVRSSAPPNIYTHPFNTSKEKGRSAAGFTICRFQEGKLTITFIDSATGQPLIMGGVTTFMIDESGKPAM